MTVATVPVRFMIGSRVLLSVPRRLQTVVQPLADLIAGRAPLVPAPVRGSDGYRFLAIPPARLAELRAAFPEHLAGNVRRQPRHFIDLAGSYDDYLASFSSKTRSTLGRKRRKLIEANGGALKVGTFRTPDEIARFLTLAGELSARTYQARLLDAGLPTGAAERARLLEHAAADRVRGYLLWLGAEPASYLLLAERDGALCYDYLGYDPAAAHLSPGTVLQLEALRELFGDRFRYLDFTEGEGAHKQLFATGSVETCSLLLLKRGVANFALLRGIEQFDARIGQVKTIAGRLGAAATIRRALKR